MIRGEMMRRMSAREYGYWQALAQLEHEEFLAKRAESEAQALANR